MDPEKLHRRLAELHTELERGPGVDDPTRELLEAVMTDIRRLLDRPPPAAPTGHEPLVERLRGATWHLEESHPRLTTAVGQLADALSRPFQ